MTKSHEQELSTEAQMIADVILAALKKTSQVDRLQLMIEEGLKVLQARKVIDQFQVMLEKDQGFGIVIFNTPSNQELMQLGFPLSL